jgi:hypothetical protein
MPSVTQKQEILYQEVHNIDQITLEENGITQVINLASQKVGDGTILFFMTLGESELRHVIQTKQKLTQILDGTLADINNDGVEDLAVLCKTDSAVNELYLWNGKTNQMLAIPALHDQNGGSGIPYQILSNDGRSVYITEDSINYQKIFPISNTDIARANTENGYFQDPIANISVSKEDYLQKYTVSKGAEIGKAGYILDLYPIDINGKVALHITQELYGNWLTDSLGEMESVISWDENGNWRLLESGYRSRVVSLSFVPDSFIQDVYCAVKEKLLWEQTDMNHIYISLVDGKEVSYQLAENVYLDSFLDYAVADFNGDGHNDLLIQCTMGSAWFLYVIDIWNQQMLTVPSLYEGGPSGIPYEILSVDSKNIRVSLPSQEYDKILPICHQDIMQVDNDISARMTEKEYLSYYDVPVGEPIGRMDEISYWEIIQNNKQTYLKIDQLVHGPWGNTSRIGIITSTIQWDKENRYRLISTVFDMTNRLIE